MRPIASRLLLAFTLIGGYGAPLLADDVPSNAGVQTSGASLPAFVPPPRRSNYTTAVNDNSESASRHAAEALSAKFSDITTSSISHDDRAPTAMPIAAEDPPHVVTERQDVAQREDGRSITLASNQADPGRSEAGKSAKDSEITPHRSNTAGAAHRLPRAAVRKASSPPPRSESGPNATLAAVGQKVGILDLLTNPALWH